MTPSDTLLLAQVADKSDANLQQAARKAVRAALDESAYLKLLPEACRRDAVGGNSGQLSIELSAQQLARACQSRKLWPPTSASGRGPHVALGRHT